MERCDELAKLARNKGDNPVGSVIVLSHKIVGEGMEQSKRLNDVTRHAEVVAIRNALRMRENLEGATLYTNVEPCILCSYVIRHHRIKKVVFSKYSRKPGGTREPYNILTATDIALPAPPAIEIYEA